MKISASIYSDKNRSLHEVIDDLVEHQVDLLHVDCNDDPTVFEDIAAIRKMCTTPIDLHIITAQPEKYFDLLRANPVEYITFQFEDLKEPLNFPADISGRKGIAVITPTPVTIFSAFEDFDFILIMATIPGQSGGKFDALNFAKIRDFRKMYPNKSIHVDGGVNGEVSFILRNMGVTSAVSGSYLFNASSVGNALMNLTKRAMESHYLVKDFMIPIEESPSIRLNELSLENVLRSIDYGRQGFTLVVDVEGKFKGLISNADIRKSLLKYIHNINELDPSSMINSSPLVVLDSGTVLDMLRLIKFSRFPVSYLPVLNKGGFAVGIVTFVNLVKGEL
jgi:pentose-5-phosphate-3-epimerase